MRNIKSTIIKDKKYQAGTYSTITNKILLDKSLTGDAFRLITFMLNNSESYVYSQEQLSETFNMSMYSVKTATNLLKECGYLDIKKYGKRYKYTISQYGNLTTDSKKKKTKVEPIQPKVQDMLLEVTPEPNETTGLSEDEKTEIITEYLKSLEAGFYEGILNYVLDIKFDSKQEFKVECEKIEKKVLTDYYSFCLKNTKNLEGEVKRIQDGYKKKLKDVIFNKKSINVDFGRMWVHYKNRYKSRTPIFEH